MENKGAILLLLGAGAVAVAFMLRPKAEAKADPVGAALGAAAGVVDALTPIVKGYAGTAAAVGSLPGAGVNAGKTVVRDVYGGAKTAVKDVYGGAKGVVKAVNPFSWF